MHLAVVDPGVGSPRPPIAVACRDGTFLVGPANGLLDRVARRSGVRAAVRLERRRYVSIPRVGTTFDARDLFAPAAAALASGRALEELGEPFEYRPPRPPAPQREGALARGRVVHVDHFGNAITDLPSRWFGGPGSPVVIRLPGRPPVHRRLVRSYVELAPGSWGVLPSSFGTLEIALPRESAAARLGLPVGTGVTARRAPSTPRRAGHA